MIIFLVFVKFLQREIAHFPNQESSFALASYMGFLFILGEFSSHHMNASLAATHPSPVLVSLYCSSVYGISLEQNVSI